MKELNTPKFIQKAIEIHGTKFNYSLVDYKNNKIKVKIICPIHGTFEQTPNHHLSGHECKKCGNVKTAIQQMSNTKDFTKEAQKIHKSRFDYSLVDYRGNKIKVKIICKEHGMFEQTPNNHLNNRQGCPSCYGNKKHTTKEFIEKVEIIHKNKFDYSLVRYIRSTDKVKIICPEHGIFEQQAHSHLCGIGCPICKASKGEHKISEWLETSNIKFAREKTFNNCRGKHRLLPFDFYLPKYNLCIEYDGKQHFQPVFGIETFVNTQQTDNIKNKYCEENSIGLLRIPYQELNNVEFVLQRSLL